MNSILRHSLLLSGLALATPAFAWSVWPDVDYEWYANVGRPSAADSTVRYRTDGSDDAP